MSPPGLPWNLRVEVWDAGLSAVRKVLRAAQMREVSTPVCVSAVAIEPWIEPLTASANGRPALLATSPELAMKQLLARGSGSIFQIAHVFRAAEIGARHSQEFHLIEWYRTPGELREVIADVEAIVDAVFTAVAPLSTEFWRSSGGTGPRAPDRWKRVELLGLMGETLGVELEGDETSAVLEPLLGRVRSESGVGLNPCVDEPESASERDPELRLRLDQLEAWTELFSLWSDTYLDPWLARLGPGVGVHMVDFPAPLAALARHHSRARLAHRFESHVGGVELANGYLELRDAAEQRRRFECVAALRARHRLPTLPSPEAFLAELDALPDCSGAALGLDRLLARACGCARLDQVSLAPSS